MGAGVSFQTHRYLNWRPYLLLYRLLKMRNSRIKKYGVGVGYEPKTGSTKVGAQLFVLPIAPL